MRYLTSLIPVCALLLLPEASLAAGTQRFDGIWQTTVSCAVARDALGYSFRFISTVKEGILHGLHATAGQPSSLQIDGTIEADGTGKLYARGFAGSKEFVPGRDTPRGTEYGYMLDSRARQGPAPVSRAAPARYQFVKQ